MANKLKSVFKAINSIKPVITRGAARRAVRNERKQREVEQLVFTLACGAKYVEKRADDGTLKVKTISLSAASTANIITRLLSMGVGGDELMSLVPDIGERFPWQGCREALFELASHRKLDLTTVAIVFGLEDETTRVVASEPATPAALTKSTVRTGKPGKRAA